MTKFAMYQQAETPPYRKVAAALRTTTERLARELVHPESDVPAWSEFEWDVARAVAAMHGISVLLTRRLRWYGPPRWQQFLREQREHGLRRDVRIGELLLRIDLLARHERIGVVALKGSALHALGIYLPGERPMGDIDLLARGEDFPATRRALRAMEYEESFTTERHVVFGNVAPRLPRGIGEHIDNPLKIELHSHIADALPATMVDITARLMPAPLAHGVNRYRSIVALMSHLLLHAAGNMRAHALRLVQLHDIARLATRMDASDWAELAAARDAGAPAWWAYPPLLLAQRYCDAAVPAALIADLRVACPWTLARAARRYSLTDVSWSNLSIAALPGIEWSRSLFEGLRFAKSRLLPARVALNELAVASVQQPQLSGIPWYMRSHAERILRWVFTRTPRVQTMTSVLAALARETG
jgi:hypothetical protein